MKEIDQKRIRFVSLKQGEQQTARSEYPDRKEEQHAQSHW